MEPRLLIFQALGGESNLHHAILRHAGIKLLTATPIQSLVTYLRAIPEELLRALLKFHVSMGS